MPLVGPKSRGVLALESKGPSQIIRVTTPLNLELALEGLVRKILREQPRQENIYSYAADYFDTLLAIRDKAEEADSTPAEICPDYTEAEAIELIKLATSFPKPSFSLNKHLSAVEPEPELCGVVDANEIEESIKEKSADDDDLNGSHRVENEEAAKVDGEDELINGGESEDVEGTQNVEEQTEALQDEVNLENQIENENNTAKLDEVENEDKKEANTSDENIENTGEDATDEVTTDAKNLRDEEESTPDETLNKVDDGEAEVKNEEESKSMDDENTGEEKTEEDDNAAVITGAVIGGIAAVGAAAAIEDKLSNGLEGENEKTENELEAQTEGESNGDQIDIKDELGESTADEETSQTPIEERKMENASEHLIAAEKGEVGGSETFSSSAALISSESSEIVEPSVEGEENEKDIIREFIEKEKEFSTLGNSTRIIEVAEVYEYSSETPLPDTEDAAVENTTEGDETSAVEKSTIAKEAMAVAAAATATPLLLGGLSNENHTTEEKNGENVSGLIGGVPIKQEATDGDVILRDVEGSSGIIGGVTIPDNDETHEEVEQNKEDKENVLDDEFSNETSNDSEQATVRRRRDLSLQMSESKEVEEDEERKSKETEEVESAQTETASENEISSTVDQEPTIESQKVASEHAVEEQVQGEDEVAEENKQDTETEKEERVDESQEEKESEGEANTVHEGEKAEGEEAKAENVSDPNTDELNEDSNDIKTEAADMTEETVNEEGTQKDDIEEGEEDLTLKRTEAISDEGTEDKKESTVEVEEEKKEDTSLNKSQEDEKESEENLLIMESNEEDNEQESKQTEQGDINGTVTEARAPTDRTNNESQEAENDGQEDNGTSAVREEKEESSDNVGQEEHDLDLEKVKSAQKERSLSEVRLAASSAVDEIVEKAEKMPLEAAGSPVNDAEQNEELGGEGGSSLESGTMEKAQNEQSGDEPSEEAPSKEDSTDIARSRSSKDTESLDDENPFISAEVKSLVEPTGEADGEEVVREDSGSTDSRDDENDVIVPLNAAMGTIEEKEEGLLLANVSAIRAAMIIQKNFRKYLQRKRAELEKQGTENSETAEKTSISKEIAQETTSTESSLSSSATKIPNKRSDFAENTLDTDSLSETTTRSNSKNVSSTERANAVPDSEVWNTLEKELDTAATTIQTSYRQYKSKKRLRREDAVQITTTASEDSLDELPYTNFLSTSELHDTVIPEEK